VVTFVGANVAGAAAAVSYQNQQVASAQAAIESAKSGFDRQVKLSLDDGTPKESIDPITAQEKTVADQSLPAAAFIIDRTRLEALQKRGAAIEAFTGQVKAAESQVVLQLHQQVVDALKSLRDDFQPASGAGVDVAEFSAFADQNDAANAKSVTPKEILAALDAINAKHNALKDVTAQKIAANQALASAQQDAKNGVASAQAALVKAQAIPVLRVGDNAAAVAALADRLAHASGTNDYQDIAAKAWAQSTALNALLTTRQSAYDLLGSTRTEIGMAQAAGKDVAQDSTNLDAAAKQLDVAGDLPSLTAAKAAIQAVKSAVDAKYWQAIYGQGKVIVVSIQKQELIALDSGNVKVDTPVTTGRPALPTPPGVYHIIFKSSPYHMVSPWPPGSPYYYHPVDMKYAMEFIDDGTFLHDAPWRSRYGPGTNGDNGTHGCVNVPEDPRYPNMTPGSAMGVLYSWAEVGTTVVVLRGDFGSSPT
jgi:lipoprotein-anchoring transpeptidase ErfK/SrfK